MIHNKNGIKSGTIWEKNCPDNTENSQIYSTKIHIFPNIDLKKDKKGKIEKLNNKNETEEGISPTEST